MPAARNVPARAVQFAPDFTIDRRAVTREQPLSLGAYKSLPSLDLLQVLLTIIEDASKAVESRLAGTSHRVRCRAASDLVW